MTMHQSTWSSRIGFILASAGAAIGLGAIWKFPYLVGSNGGSAFLFPFLILTFTVGLVLLIAELAIGRLGGNSIVSAFRKLGGPIWSKAGYLGVVTGFLVLSFYSAIGGWTISYFINALLGNGLVADQSLLGEQFAQLCSSPIKAVGFQGLFLALTAYVVWRGVNSGIERLSKVLMPLLLIMMLIIIVRCLFLPGALDGVAYLFSFSADAFNMDSLFSAMGFTFFSLCLGSGCMLTYGCYLDNKVDIIGSSIWITFLTVLTSLMGALMIMPAVFAFGLDPAAGPALTYITMPAIFAQLPFGHIFCIMFYACILVAALTSAVSMLEIDVAFFQAEYAWSRKKAVIVTAIGLQLVGALSALSFGPLADYKLAGRNFFDWIDYLTSNISLPIGGLMVAILCGWVAWKPLREKLCPPQTKVYPPMVFKLLRFAIAALAPAFVSIIFITSL